MTDQVRLTSFSHGAGCACKLSPEDLRTVLGLVRNFDAPADPNLLVGFDTADDAAVYRLRDDLAIVVTTDFFTPIVDDPFDWGRIAATNALSDVYAMGGTPLLALNLVAWPREGLPFELLARVLDGGAAIAADAGCLIAGGHSIDDAEPKYGLAVVGTVDPMQVLTNAAAQAGDALVLTKPIGLGVISTAVKQGRSTEAHLGTAIEVMTTLNASARDAALEVGVHAATDVTGFGLLGHLREMCVASSVGAVVDFDAVPVIDGVRALLDAGMVAGGTRRNHAFVAPDVDFGDLPETEQLLLCDAQTSGGLLLALPADERGPTCRRPGGARHAGRRRHRPDDGSAGPRADPLRFASGDDEHPELGFELLAGLGADDRALHASVAEHPDHGDALHVELLRDRRLVVDVDLDDLVGALAHRGDGLDNRRDLAAGAAPRSPEVDDHGRFALQHLAFEVRGRHCGDELDGILGQFLVGLLPRQHARQPVVAVAHALQRDLVLHGVLAVLGRDA